MELEPRGSNSSSLVPVSCGSLWGKVEAGLHGFGC